MNQMELLKPENDITLDDEKKLVDSWEKLMPPSVAELYVPVSKISDNPERKSFMAENRLDESRVVIVCSEGSQREILRAESDVMDILVLGCIPRKTAFYEMADRSILVREYVSGESLQGALNRIGTFSEPEVRLLGEDLCVLIQELYERNLSVDASKITAQNIIITNEGMMKFVEPEGIEYCENCEENWAETEKAIGKLMNTILTGNTKSGKRLKTSGPMATVIARSMGKRGSNYGSVSKLLRALEGTAPGMTKRRRGATAVALAAASLLAVIAVFPLLKNLTKPSEPDPGSKIIGEVIPTDVIPVADPDDPDVSPTPSPDPEENK